MGISRLKETRLGGVSACLVQEGEGVGSHGLESHKSSGLSPFLGVLLVEKEDDSNVFSTCLVQPLNSAQ